jgi:hypothetical protein
MRFETEVNATDCILQMTVSFVGLEDLCTKRKIVSLTRVGATTRVGSPLFHSSEGAA